MKTADGSFHYCFNAQTIVDERSQVVLTSVLRQSGADCPALPQMLTELTASLAAAGIDACSNVPGVGTEPSPWSCPWAWTPPAAAKAPTQPDSPISTTSRIVTPLAAQPRTRRPGAGRKTIARAVTSMCFVASPIWSGASPLTIASG